MKATGIVRRVDDEGRIVIPKEIRLLLGWDSNTPIEIFTDGNDIFLCKHDHGCVFCNKVSNDNIKISGKEVCRECAKMLKGYV